MTRDLTTNNSLFTTTNSEFAVTDNYFEAKKRLSPLQATLNDHRQHIETNREFLLFPTYAKRNPLGNNKFLGIFLHQ
jgi:hypothetical protein